MTARPRRSAHSLSLSAVLDFAPLCRWRNGAAGEAACPGSRGEDWSPAARAQATLSASRTHCLLESGYFAWGPGAGVAPLVEFSVLPFTHVHWVCGRRHPEAVGLESLTESRTDGGRGPHTPDAGHATWASRLQHRPRAGWDRTCLSLGTGRRLAPGM